MAFQQQGGMGNSGGGGNAEHHAPPATEYTLQGVMRFLQIEWHNHERARNAWDIERAEMKAKIAKQEGECRQAKRINEQLERQVKMLEMALKNERAKNKLPNGTPSEGMEVTKEGEAASATVANANAKIHVGAHVKPPNLPHNSFLDISELQDSTEKEREQYLDNTTKYLKKCMKEIQVLLTPLPHPPPPQMLPNGHLSGLPDPPMIMEDVYARHQQRPARQPAQALPPQSNLANHHQSAIPNSLPQSTPHDDPRGNRYGGFTNQQPSNESLQPSQQTNASYDEPVESVVHTYDARGRPVPEQDAQKSVNTSQTADTETWTFDDEAPVQLDTASLDAPQPRRPDTDLFPSAANSSQMLAKSPPRAPGSHRRKSSGSQPMSRRRSSQGKNETRDGTGSATGSDVVAQFRVKFALRGHLDVVRSVVFSGGGSPGEPELCTAGDDGTIKRWMIPATYQGFNPAGNATDLDIQAYFTHRGHEGIVTSLATCPAMTAFSTGGRANGDGWMFSGGQDATIRVWERGRVDPKATLEGHTDAVWSVCVLPATVGSVFGQQGNYWPPDRLLLVSGSADGTVKVWAVSAPPQTSSPATGSRRGVGGSRRHSVTSGSNFPSSPQPSVASTTPFNYTLIHSIERAGDVKASPTSICPLSPTGETFVVSYTDAAVLIYDTRTGEEIIGMASTETYDGTMNTSINSVIATSLGRETDAARGLDGEDVGAATGSRDGIEGVVISGHEDKYVRFYDANSGQGFYSMLAHPAAIAALTLSKDGREAVSAGHDASIRFWSLDKRTCTQEIISHRAMRGEGVCDVCWSQDGRLVATAGGDGVVKVFAR